MLHLALFYVVAGTQTQVLLLAQQACYQLGHFSSPGGLLCSALCELPAAYRVAPVADIEDGVKEAPLESKSYCGRWRLPPALIFSPAMTIIPNITYVLVLGYESDCKKMSISYPGAVICVRFQSVQSENQWSLVEKWRVNCCPNQGEPMVEGTIPRTFCPKQSDHLISWREEAGLVCS